MIPITIFIIHLINIFIINIVNAQTSSFSEVSSAMTYRLEITEHKTSLLIFSTGIQSADRGANYILAERVKGVENALKIKAAKRDFEPSNLQVITVDGKVYTFNLFYAAQPEVLTMDLRKQPQHAPITFEGVSINDKELKVYAGIIAALEPAFKKARFAKYGLELYLQGIYTKNDVLFLSYTLKNHSTLRFAPASFRFYIRDKMKAKRSAIRDNETIPLHITYIGKPEESQGQSIVVAFPKFSMAEDKLFAAELMELNGDRNPVSRFDQSLLWRSRILR